MPARAACPCSRTFPIATALAWACATAAPGAAAIRIDEIAWSGTSGTGPAFVELLATAPGATRDPALGLRVTDHTGVVTADLADGVLFGAHAGEPWPAGGTWLIGGGGFAARAGFAPDLAAPVSLDRIGGALTLYAVDSTGAETGVDSVRWSNAEPGALRLPYAGQSLQRLADGGFTLQAHPTPTTSRGITGTAAFGYVPNFAFALDEAAFACKLNVQGVRFIELVALAPGHLLDPNVNLRITGAGGQTLGQLTGVFGAAALRTVPWNARFLLASAASGLAADRPLTNLPDASGGALTLYATNAAGDTEIVLSSLVYGGAAGATVAVPPAGQSLERAPGGGWSVNPMPTPTDLAGQGPPLGTCFGADTTGAGVRVVQFGLACATGQPGAAFLTLGCTLDPAQVPASIGLLLSNRLGSPLADLPHVFGSRAGQAFRPGRTYLVATAAFAAATGLAPDTLLPAPPDTLGGVVDVYVFNPATGSRVAIQEFRYGQISNPKWPSPAPGGSLALQPDGTYARILPATPVRFDGGAALGACFGEYFVADIVPAAPQLRAGSVVLEWSGARPGGVYALERSPDGSAWSTLGPATADSAGDVRAGDGTLEPGDRAAYRLTLGGEGTPATWVQVPQAAFALAPVAPQPLAGDLVVRFTLPARGPAQLALFDLAGRRLRQLEVGDRSGDRRLTLAARGALAPGVYVLRLARGGERRVRTVVVVP